VTKSADIRIRLARFPEDTATARGFLMALQRYEHAFEPNRRTDQAVAEEYLAVLRERAEKDNGIFIAENRACTPLGWAVIYPDSSEVYVIEEERNLGRLTELFVEAEARGQGVGRALIGACEDWARACGFKHIIIGALAENDLALDVYQASGFTPYAMLLRKYL